MTNWRFFGGDVAVVRCGDEVVKLRNHESYDQYHHYHMINMIIRKMIGKKISNRLFLVSLINL